MIKPVILATLAALTTSENGAAQPRPRPPASAPATVRSQADLDAQLREVTKTSQPAQALAYDVHKTVTQLVEGLILAMQRGADPGAREADRAWAESWRREQLSRLSSLRARAAALPPIRFAGPVPAEAEARRRLEMLQRLPKEVEALTERAVLTATPLLDLAVEAAASDATALKRLPAETMTASMVLMEAENQQLKAQADVIPPDHPGRHLLLSNIAGNQGLAALLEHQHALATGRQLSAKATADRVRARAAEMRQAASAISDTAKAVLKGDMVAFFRKESPETHGRMVRMLTSYQESSDVELQIADVLRITADALEKGPAGLVELSQMRDLDPLVTRRMRLQESRQAIMAP